ncbi:MULTISPECIES: ribosome hibernation-promoting factor, HPF/YfiA family [Isoptericola]|uniref:Ribosome hibernation promoting factor n=1 Tax=Isoptericola sediminis TaxID=2733572 RepID=A0A849JZ83_9MICO|nr:MULTISPECIES: ribosome-associated translation inhibitor RaiA [Isoptericola]MDO8144169.1 ribosome-associated translation inhibitor RaiA [Isoptericola sp. 178]MDO8151499.1 ribosome-associated translation inhibitor RaiA [Isoptericola sp. b408]NNU27864.1 ribosome-associated translation inhibitor RaiA [Isoptericola sediminis]
MEIAVVGRHTDVTDKFREHVQDKLTKVTQLSPNTRRVDVEVTHENNPRLSDVSERVELTVRSKGPIIRAEAAADDRFAALDLAMEKLSERLRRSRDRHKKDHRRRGAEDARPFADPSTVDEVLAERSEPEPAVLETPGDSVEHQLGDSPVVIRQKLHHGEPMTVDDAVERMELVGHDFFLFIDKESARPAAVYRRRGWSYGVIELDTTCAAAAPVTQLT